MALARCLLRPKAAVEQGMRAMASQAAQHEGFVELRQYTLHPSGIKEFLRLTNEKLELRQQLLPFLGMFMCDTGGVLNRVVHFYHYDDYDHRDRCRKAAGGSAEWQDNYLVHSRKCVQSQESHVFLPAPGVLRAGLASPIQHFRPPAAPAGSPQPVYEMRQYQLQPGAGALEALLGAMERGAADLSESGQGQLVFAGHTEVGPANSVLELWRYPSAQACVRSRRLAQALPSWQQWDAAVAGHVQQLSAAFMQPVGFSPMQ